MGGLRSGRTAPQATIASSGDGVPPRKLRTKSVVGVVRLDLIVRMALIEWLVIRESHDSQKSIETDKIDISINDNG